MQVEGYWALSLQAGGWVKVLYLRMCDRKVATKRTRWDSRRHAKTRLGCQTVTVIPVLLYGTEAWFPGLTRPSSISPGKVVRSGIQHLLDRQSRPLLQGTRAVLPVWKTTPRAALHYESGISPISVLLRPVLLPGY